MDESNRILKQIPVTSYKKIEETETTTLLKLGNIDLNNALVNLVAQKFDRVSVGQIYDLVKE
jgi:hypothetical protein